jgi:protein-S-isoprenylcysteine O-methyltransferase Ste14
MNKEVESIKSQNLNFVSREGDLVPASCIGLLGLLGFALGLLIAFYFKLSSPYSAILVLFLTALPMVAAEVVLNRVFLRQSSGLALKASRANPARCARKYLGLLTALGSIGFIYWLLPEYRKDTYLPAITSAYFFVPVALILAIPYFAWVDARQIQPEDAFYKVGSFVMGNKPRWEVNELRDFVLGFCVKGFFLPIMLSFLAINIEQLLKVGFSIANFADFYITVISTIYTLDVTFGAIGYLLTLRIIDAQIRTPDRTAFGWFFTLMCYPPFLTIAGKSIYSLKEERSWQDVLITCPWIYVTWGFTILVLLGFYVWATICFGCRFSNLTNRGVITFGPYRYMKHPAYFFKCTSWWFMAAPFMSFSSVEMTVKASLLLTVKCGVYFMRARAEERHLRQDPAYLRYCEWIEENGILATLRRNGRNLKYRLRKFRFSRQESNR